jgi:hypothetical protein
MTSDKPSIIADPKSSKEAQFISFCSKLTTLELADMCAKSLCIIADDANGNLKFDIIVEKKDFVVTVVRYKNGRPYHE